MKTVAELEVLWNAQADECNQWASLGLDEMIEFAQAENWMTPLNQAEEDSPQAEALLEVSWNIEHGQQILWRELSRGRKLAYALDQGRAEARRERSASATVDEKGAYHDVMECLRDMQMPHGTCEQRARRACTHCNASERLQELVAEYRGRPAQLA